MHVFYGSRCIWCIWGPSVKCGTHFVFSTRVLRRTLLLQVISFNGFHVSKLNCLRYCTVAVTWRQHGYVMQCLIQLLRSRDLWRHHDQPWMLNWRSSRRRHEPKWREARYRRLLADSNWNLCAPHSLQLCRQCVDASSLVRHAVAGRQLPLDLEGEQEDLGAQWMRPSVSESEEHL